MWMYVARHQQQQQQQQVSDGDDVLNDVCTLHAGGCLLTFHLSWTGAWRYNERYRCQQQVIHSPRLLYGLCQPGPPAVSESIQSAAATAPGSRHINQWTTQLADDSHKDDPIPRQMSSISETNSSHRSQWPTRPYRHAIVKCAVTRFQRRSIQRQLKRSRNPFRPIRPSALRLFKTVNKLRTVIQLWLTALYKCIYLFTYLLSYLRRK